MHVIINFDVVERVRRGGADGSTLGPKGAQERAQCQFLYSAVFVFQKSCSGNILGIGQNEARSPYFSVTYTESEGDSKGAAAKPCGGAPPTWPRHHMVWAPWAPTNIALPPIYSVPRENPKYPSLHPRKIPQPPPSSTLVREASEALPGTLPKRGIITRGLFITMPASRVMRAQFILGLQVHSSSQIVLFSTFVPSCLDLVSCLT